MSRLKATHLNATRQCSGRGEVNLREISITLSEAEWIVVFHVLSISTEMLANLPPDFVPMQSTAAIAGEIARRALKRKLEAAGCEVDFSKAARREQANK